MRCTERAYAKINLTLDVGAKRADGYHEITSVMQRISMWDTVTVERGTGRDTLRCSVPVTEDVNDNLCMKALRVFFTETAMESGGVSITLEKHIPTQAGLGGGSSDAAETMKLINDIFSLGLREEEMETKMRAYGADCPFFIRQKPVYAEGTGDVFSPVELTLRGLHFVLVKPRESVSTARAYGMLTPRPSVTDIRDILKGDIDTWKDRLRNDFEGPVFRMHPAIGAIKQTLYDMGAVYAQMSGSGSAVFGIFRGEPSGDERKIFRDCFTFRKELAI